MDNAVGRQHAVLRKFDTAMALVLAAAHVLVGCASSPVAAQVDVGHVQLALTEPEFIARDAELQDRRRVYGLVGATAVGLSALSLGIALLVASRSETPHVPGLEGPLMMMLGSGLVALVAFIGVGVVGGRRRHLQGVSVEESLTVSSASPVGWAVSF